MMEGLMGVLTWVLESSARSTAVFLMTGTTAVLLFALLTARMMRRSAAAERHALWVLALLAVLALPLAALSVPWRWSVPVTEVVTPIQAEARSTSSSAVVPRSATQPAGVETSRRFDGVVDAADRLTGSGATGADLTGAGGAGELLAGATGVHVGARAGARVGGGGPGAARVVVALWGMVALGLFAHVGLGLMVLWRLGRRATPAPERLVLMANRVVAAMGEASREVRVAIGEPGQMPMTWGLVHPVVLLPQEALEWADDRLEMVLSHELAHVARADAGTILIGRLAAALYWFNPLVWIALSRLRAESERAADDHVLRSGTRASDYAHHLVEIVSGRSRGFLPATALPMAHRSHFEGRVIAILEADARRETPSRRRLGLLATALVAVVLGITGAAPERAVSEESADAPTAVVTPTLKEASTLVDPGSASTKATRAARDLDVATARRSPVERAEVQPRVVPQTADPSDASDLVGSSPQVVQEDPRSVAALSRVLTNDADPEVRRTAAWALGQIEDVAASEALQRAVRQDDDAEVRQTAVWALGQIQDHGAVDALVDALSDTDPQVRATAVWALGRIQDDRAVDGLVGVMGDADPEVRKDAAWALGQIQDRSAVPALVRALTDAEPGVRAQAVWALGQIEDRASVDALGRALGGDDNARVRAQAAWALGQIQEPGSLDALSAALSDPVAEVRSQAAWAIGQLEPATAPVALLDAVADQDADVRRTALWALYQIEDPSAVPVLVGALQHDDERTRMHAMRALAAVGTEESLSEVARLLDHANPEIRAAAARALGGGMGPNPNPRPNPRPRPRPRPRPNGG